MMKISTCLALSPTHSDFAPLYFSGNLEAGFEAAACLGYDGVELNLLDSGQLNQDKLLDQINQLSLSVVSIGTGQSYFQDGLSLADLRENVQETLKGRMKDHIRFASRLGAQVVLGSIRGILDRNDPERNRAGYQIAVCCTRELAEFASELGVKLTIEPINRYETNFINTVAESLDFISQINQENVGILVDTFHMNIEERNLSDSIVEAGDLLWHCHLADSNRHAIGLGHLDFDAVFRSLEKIGYAGFASAENIPYPDDFTSARIWIKFFRRLVTNLNHN